MNEPLIVNLQDPLLIPLAYALITAGAVLSARARVKRGRRIRRLLREGVQDNPELFIQKFDSQQNIEHPPTTYTIFAGSTLFALTMLGQSLWVPFLAGALHLAFGFALMILFSFLDFKRALEQDHGVNKPGPWKWDFAVRNPWQRAICQVLFYVGCMLLLLGIFHGTGTSRALLDLIRP